MFKKANAGIVCRTCNPLGDRAKRMRRDLRPYFLHLIQTRWQAWWVNHFLKPQLDSCGVGIQVIGPRHFQISGPHVRLGNHVHIMTLPEAPVRLSVFEEMGSVSIGDFSLVNPGVRVTSAEAITIGRSCMLAMHCLVSDADWHDVQHRIYAPGKTAKVILEDNVWLGEGVRVLKGVTIGENTVVGAGSVVTRSLPANVIAAGNPARVIKPLIKSDRTTREALFTMDQTYDQFADEWMRDRLKANAWSSWLRSLLFPGKSD
jgi:acetyltransferase-like isoleucine patch superfamily enzyme